MSGFKIEVYTGQTLVDSAYVLLNSGHLPQGYVPGAGSSHDYASKVFILLPGNHHIMAYPMKSETVQSTVCAVAETDVLVTPGNTTTVALVSECSGQGNGAGEIVAALNNNPQILNVAYNPSEFVSTCQNLTVTLTAQDPDGDAPTYNWTMTQAPSVPPSNTKSISLSRPDGQYLTAADSASLSITDTVTLEAWVKLNDWGVVGQNSRIFGKFGNGGGYGMHIQNDGKFSAIYFGTGKYYYRSSDPLSPSDLGTWVHLAASIDAVTRVIKLYRNGMELPATYGGDSTATMDDTAAELYVGGMFGGEQANGKIDDLRIWHAIRSQTEIANNYQQQLNGTEPNLIGYWKLSDALADATANGNNLTFNGNGSATYSTDVPFGGGGGTAYSGSATANVYTFTAYVPGDFSLRAQVCDPFANCSLINLPIHALGSACQP